MSHYHYYNDRQISWQSVLDAVKPNVSGLAQKYKTLRTVFIIGIAVFFVAFAVCGFTAAMNFNFTVILIPFFGFGACGVGMAICASKEMVYRRLNEIIEQVKGYDKVLIPKLISTQSEAEMTAIVRKLIETGNLPDYRLVADIMVAKEEVFVSETEAREEYDRFKGVSTSSYERKDYSDTGAYKYCPSCGNRCNADDRYCSKCGRPV